MCVTTGLSAVSSQVHHQYHFVYDLRNMTEAQKYCRERYTDLATIDNMEEVTILKDMAATSQVSSPMSFFNLKAFFDNHVNDTQVESFALPYWCKFSRNILK